MVERTLDSVRKGIIAQYNAEYPEEKLYGRVFSLYVLDRYARLLLKLYRKAEKSK